jgi:hypothetical protein
MNKYCLCSLLYQPGISAINTGKFRTAIHGGPKKLNMCLLKLVPPKNSFTDSGGDSLHMGTITDMLKIIPP